MATSWVPVPSDCDWSLANIPFGIFSTAEDATPRAGTAIGESVVDLSVLAAAGLFAPSYAETLRQARGVGGSGWCVGVGVPGRRA